jgi:outer membrane receptor protein involved in Fe transport
MKYPFFLLCSLIFVNALYSQRPGTSPKPIMIKGQVVDASTNNPMEFTTVSIFSSEDSTLLSGGITDEKGLFAVDGRPGNVYVLIEFISYTTKTIANVTLKQEMDFFDLGQIKLSPDAVTLESVEIVGQKSETVFALDKRVFNVGKDLSNRGGTAQDILDNVPSVSVDVDGGVSLRGSGNVRILIDGKPSGLVGVSGANGLRSIPANMIDRVEVITNPSARYEAEGMSGIINIILKKDNKVGVNGSFEVSGGWPENYGLGANVNYRKGKTNFFVNYGLNYNNNPSIGYTYQEIYKNDSINATYIIRDGFRKRLANSIRTGLDFSISENQTLTAAFLYRYSESDNESPIRYYDHLFIKGQPTGRNLVPTLSYIERIELEKETSPTIEYNVDYVKRFKEEGREFKATIQYSLNDETENAIYKEGFYNNGNFEGKSSNQRSNNDEKQRSTVLTADYIHPINKESKFEAGLRSQIRNIGNDYLVEELINDNWNRLPNFSNQFRYNEDVHAAYAIYGNKISKFSYQAGLRMEYTGLNTELLETDQKNPRSFTNLFPSGHINYEFKGQNQVQVSFSRRIQRPRFWDLNPFFTFADNRNIMSGNPLLNPEFTNSYEIGHVKYWEKGNVGTNVFWRHTTDVIQRVTQFNPDGTSLTQPLNLATSDNAGIEFLFAYNPLKWLRLDGNANIFRNIIDGNYEGQDLGADSYSWFGRIGSRFTFWKNADLQTRLNYRAPVDIPLGQQKAMYIVDIAFSKDFWKNNATFTLAARDLFNSRRRNTELLTDDFYQRVDQQWRRAPIVATINYRLNKKKERKKAGREGGEYEGGEM